VAKYILSKSNIESERLKLYGPGLCYLFSACR